MQRRRSPAKPDGLGGVVSLLNGTAVIFGVTDRGGFFGEWISLYFANDRIGRNGCSAWGDEIYYRAVGEEESNSVFQGGAELEVRRGRGFDGAETLSRSPSMPSTAIRAAGRRRGKPRRISSWPSTPRSTRFSRGCLITWWMCEHPSEA